MLFLSLNAFFPEASARCCAIFLVLYFICYLLCWLVMIHFLLHRRPIYSYFFLCHGSTKLWHIIRNIFMLVFISNKIKPKYVYIKHVLLQQVGNKRDYILCGFVNKGWPGKQIITLESTLQLRSTSLKLTNSTTYSFALHSTQQYRDHSDILKRP